MESLAKGGVFSLGPIRLYVRGVRVYMEGGKTGSHSLSLSCTGMDRLASHLSGYLENNQLSVPFEVVD